MTARSPHGVAQSGVATALAESPIRADVGHQQVVKGDYILSCAKMGQWSEIQVIHRRHKELLLIGGVLAITGLLLRIAIRPQRVWLEEAPEGCRVWSSGTKAMNGLKSKN